MQYSLVMFHLETCNAVQVNNVFSFRFTHRVKFDDMAGMVTSDSGDDTTSQNDYVAGMDQASNSDSNDKSSSSAASRVCKNNTLQAHSFQAEQTGGT